MAPKSRAAKARKHRIAAPSKIYSKKKSRRGSARSAPSSLTSGLTWVSMASRIVTTGRKINFEFLDEQGFWDVDLIAGLGDNMFTRGTKLSPPCSRVFQKSEDGYRVYWISSEGC